MALAGRRNWRTAVDAGVKLLIIGLLLWALYRELHGELSLEVFSSLISGAWSGPHWYCLLLAVLLMPFNWGLEVVKWRTLLRPFWAVPTALAWKAVMAGVTLSLFTPNRIGEYGGRVLLVPAKHNWAAVVATAAGSIAQLIALLSGGLAGSFFYLQQSDLLPPQWAGMWWLVLTGTFLLVILFLFMPRLLTALYRVPFSNKWRERVMLLEQYSQKQLLQGLFWASCRYVLYCFQYYLLLRYFGVELPVGVALGGVAAVFLIQLFLPLPPVAALLARGEVALLIWSSFAPGKLSIITATFALFIINLLLPALLGAVFIVKTNVLKSLGYDKEAKRYNNGPGASHGVYSPGTKTTGNDKDTQ